MNSYYYVGIDCFQTRLNEKGCFYVVRLKDHFDQTLNISYENLEEAKNFIKDLDKNYFTNLKVEVIKNVSI